jgi:hypothetical protein
MSRTHRPCDGTTRTWLPESEWLELVADQQTIDVAGEVAGMIRIHETHMHSQMLIAYAIVPETADRNLPAFFTVQEAFL